jgi:hypothetical protein
LQKIYVRERERERERWWRNMKLVLLDREVEKG